jgi:hypothetical protein
MKKTTEKNISIEQAMKSSFNAGLQLGFSLRGIGSRLGPKIAQITDREEIEKILETEIHRVFNEWEILLMAWGR